MTKKALLVSINYPGTPNELHGCVNDVIAMSQLLADQNKTENSAVFDREFLAPLQ